MQTIVRGDHQPKGVSGQQTVDFYFLLLIHAVAADEPRVALEAELGDGQVDRGGAESRHAQAQAG